MKNGSLKKGILITLIIAILLAPVSAGFKTKKAEAINVNDCFKTSTLKVDQSSVNSNSATFSGTLMVGDDRSCTQGTNTTSGSKYLNAYDKIGTDSNGVKTIYFIVRDKNGDIVKDKNGKEVGKVLFSALQRIDTMVQGNGFTIDTKLISADPQTSLLLDPNSVYSVSLDIEGSFNNSSFVVSNNFTTKNANPNDSTVNYDGINKSNKTSGGGATLNLGCNSLTSIDLPSCVAQLSYVFWSVSALISRAAGTFVDFLVYYSTNDLSYRNTFVKQGWGAVRDIANIFFIIVLLYIAIKTILGLNVSNNKKLIGMVIIIALVINFSLFATELVIDGSNILAKVFYNNITSVDKNGNILPANTEGEKSVSIGLVDKFNPQILVTQEQYNTSPWTYIFLTSLLTLLILYMSYVFFSVGLLFVARVVSLWISMIFSPVAFVSYALPFKIPGFGHEEWWTKLLENAFLAPVFIFFLYIIILFAGFLTDIISYTDNKNLTSTANLMQHVMSVAIPFVVLFMLLKQAKDLAVKYSGEMGKAINKLGGAVGGFALGAATGGLALAGSSTIGKYYQGVVANNDELRAKAAAGDKSAQKRLDRANYFAKKSFDIRQTGAGKAFSKGTGLDLDKGTRFVGINTEKLKGGQKARFEKKVEKEEEKLKSYEVTQGAARTQNNIAQKYEEERDRAKKETDGDLTKKNEEWQKEYEAKARENKFSMNPIDEKTFEENYRKNNPLPTSSFDENAFKENYIKENKLKNGVGEVDINKENKNRREAYAWSLEHPNEKKNGQNEVIKKDFRDFLRVWKEGVKDMTSRPGGLATTVATGVMTGGIGLIATPIIGGLAHAIKEVVKAQIPANKELVGRVAKGKSDVQKLTEIFKKVASGDKKAEQDLAKEIEKTKGEKPSK